MSAAPRPFRILGVQQIALGGKDKARLEKLWVELFGLEVSGTYQSASENVDEAILRVGVGPHAVELDLMQPLDLAAKPTIHEPPLHHIGLWVDDLRAAVDWLRQQGLRFAPGGIRRGAAGHDVCFVHPRSDAQFPFCGEGVLIELVQAPSEVIAHLTNGTHTPKEAP